jgi:hypothetical protein
LAGLELVEHRHEDCHGQTQVPQPPRQEDAKVGDHEVDYQHSDKDNGDDVVGEYPTGVGPGIGLATGRAILSESINT